MHIYEHDIFNYVFFPHVLSDDKKIYLETNRNLYKEELEFYSNFNKPIPKDINDKLDTKVEKKLNKYFQSIVIELHPIKEPQKQKFNEHKLAAASRGLTPQMITKTFLDEEKEILIKVIGEGETTKIYIFSTKNERINNFDIIIEPLGVKYHLQNNLEPLKIEKVIDIESIKIQLT